MSAPAFKFVLPLVISGEGGHHGQNCGSAFFYSSHGTQLFFFVVFVIIILMCVGD